MTGFSAPHFGAGFLQAYTQGQQLRDQQDQNKKEMDAKLKLYEIQLQREQQQNAALANQQGAQKQLSDLLQGQPSMPNGLVAPGLPGVSAQARPPMSLTDLLADPRTALTVLQSGFLKGEDVLKNDQQTKNRALLSTLMGGGQPGQAAPAAGPGGASRMELTGVKVGPDGQIMPDFGLPQITTQTIDTPAGPRIRTFNPRTGQTVADLGAGKPDQVTPDTAGRISGLIQAQQIGNDVKTKFLNPDGSVNRGTVLTSFVRAPGTEGRKVRDDLAIAIDSVLRARTGAGVNKEEMQQVLDQFLPHPLDSDAEIANKFNRLDQFIGGSLNAVTLPPSIQQRVKSQGAGGGRVVDFNALPK